jgi:hypothetical protein
MNCSYSGTGGAGCKNPEAVVRTACVVAGGGCNGLLVSVSKLTGILNATTGKSGPGSGDRNSAPERVLILSRLGLPFWNEEVWKFYII